MESELIDYQCCFCGQGVARKGADVGLLSYTPRFDAGGQQTQDLFRHATCLGNVLHTSVPLYVLGVLEPEVDEQRG